MQHVPQTAVLGVSGYAGAELARLLLRHRCLQGTPPLFFGREEGASEPLTAIHPQLGGYGRSMLHVEPFSLERLAGVDVLFLATPHEQSRALVPQALRAGVKVVDLSGAWRLAQASNRAIYKFSDEYDTDSTVTQSASVYGMPELHRERLADARLVANPGCYATSVILALKPLIAAAWVDLDHGIVCDSKSGVSGAGKAPTATTHFMHAADNLSAYALFGHRHTGELLEQLGITGEHITFTPHLLPIPRGILSTIYIRFAEKRQSDDVEQYFRSFYAESPMVRIYNPPALPEIQHSVHTSFADIGFRLASDGRRCILISCLDNLLKGAASQAVQNLNLMCGWSETEGLL